MADLITLEGLAVRFGRTFTTAEEAQAGLYIADASALVVDVVGDSTVTDTWDAVTVPPSVVPVVAAMVRRAMDNPLGFSQETHGDYTYSTGSTSGIFTTPAEERTIRRAAAKNAVGTVLLESHLTEYPVSPPLGSSW